MLVRNSKIPKLTILLLICILLVAFKYLRAEHFSENDEASGEDSIISQTPTQAVQASETADTVYTTTPKLTKTPYATLTPTVSATIIPTSTPIPTTTLMPTTSPICDPTEVPQDVENSKFCDMSIFKSVGLIGDSFTAGIYSYLEDGEEKRSYDVAVSWGNQLAQRYGIKAKNYGWGGATIKKWLEVPNQYKTAFDEDEVCDVYTIAFGINDKNKSGISKSNYDPTFWYSDLGTPNDEVGEDTFYGYLKEICEYVHTKAPNAPIFIITPYKYYKGWNEAIKYMASIYDFVYDADINSVCPYHVGDDSGYFMSHPTISGYAMLTDYFEVIFNEIINKNKNDIMRLLGEDY